MLVTLANPLARRTILISAVVLAALLSYFSFRDAAAEYFSSQDSLEGIRKAASLEPGDARNWHLLGRYWQFNLEQQDFPRAIGYYRHSLLLNPRDPIVWLDLASAYEAQGDRSAARSAYISAQKSHPISAEVAWRYGNFLLRQGEIDSAFGEFRRSLAAEPARTYEAVSVCWSVRPDPKVLLEEILPPKPAVYLAALQSLASHGAVEASLEVWNRLLALHPRFPLRETSFLVDLLLNTGHGEEASRVWKQALALAEIPDPGGPPGSILWDGGFESDVQGGLSWRLQDEPGVQAGYDSAVKHSGNRSVQIQFDGSGNPGIAGVCQMVPVKPETAYEFSGWIRTDAISTDRGIRVTLTAQDSPGASTAEFLGTQPWTFWTLAWKTGKESRIAQVCASRVPSEKIDNKISGLAWLDDLALIPVPSSASRKAQP